VFLGKSRELQSIPILAKVRKMIVASPPIPVLLNIPISSFIQDTSNSNQYLSAKISPQTAWNELILSWNMKPSPNASLIVEVRLFKGNQSSSWYCLGRWNPTAVAAFTKTNEPSTSDTPGVFPRSSVANQDDSWATVNTDTLHLKQPADTIQIRLTTQDFSDLNLLTGSFATANLFATPRPSDTSAWGVLLDAPKRYQNRYPNGGVICSATSTSMLLGYWSQRLGIPSLDNDVPDVVASVYDEGWKGTGNWPFNTAYAGSLPGMTGYVSRLRDIRDLESLIAAGFPVACSVSYNLLKGKPRGSDDGHLVVLVGFTADGDPIFNDPASHEVHTTFKRADFELGWEDSSHTVYLIYPTDVKLPNSTDHEWIGSHS